MNSQTKTCSICKQEKPIEDFYKTGSTADRRQSSCKPCYYQRYGDKIREANKAWREQNPELAREYFRDWYRRNKQKHIKNVVEDIKRKTKENPQFREFMNTRHLFYHLLYKAKRPMQNTINKFGYDHLQLRSRLMPEIIKLLKEGKTPEIDHKINYSWFIPGTPANVWFHLDNLRVVTEEANREKRDHYSTPVPYDYFILAYNWVKPEYQSEIEFEGKNKKAA